MKMKATMHSTNTCFALLVGLVLLVVSGCVDDAVSPLKTNDIGGVGEVELSVESAAPFTAVFFHGLIGESYAEAQVAVGGEEAPLFVSDEGEVHFVVPILPPGPTDVVLRVADGSIVTLDLRIVEPDFIDGRVAATVDSVVAGLDEVLVALSMAALRVHEPTERSRSEAIREMQRIVVETREDVAALTGDDAWAFAAFYRANQTVLSLGLYGLAEGLRINANEYPSLPSTQALPAGHVAVENVSRGIIPTAEDIVRICDERVRSYDSKNDLAEKLKWPTIIAGGLIVIGTGGAALPAVVPLIGVVNTGANLWALSAAQSAFLPTPEDGLVVQPGTVYHQPSDVGYLAGVATLMSPNIAENLVNAGADIAGFGAKALGIARRIGEKTTQLGGLIARLGYNVGTEVVEVNDLFEVRRIQSEVVPIALHGLGPSFELGDSLIWKVATDNMRGLTTRFTVGEFAPDGDVPIAAELVPVRSDGEPRESTRNICRLITGAPDYERRRNGFRIGTGTGAQIKIAIDDDRLMEAPEGQRTHFSLPVWNTGFDVASEVTVLLGQIDDKGNHVEWEEAPAGIEVTLSSFSPATIHPGYSRTATLRVRVDYEAPLKEFHVPIVAFHNSGDPDTTSVLVSVTSQMADLIVNSRNGQISIYDDATEDADSIRVLLNGQVVRHAVRLWNAPEVIDVTYQVGPNVLEIYAINEGWYSPNTAGVIISDVVDGSAHRSYRLNTGQTARLLIYYDPDAATSDAVGIAQDLSPRYHAKDELPSLEDR